MKRAVVSCLAAVFVAVLVAACDDGGRPHHHRMHREACTVQPSCGTCTPVLGCGWCFTAGSAESGVCVADPEDCPRGSLGFTWDPPGCTGAHDGGIPDAATDAPRSLADAQVGGDGGDASEDASDAAPR